LKRNCTLKLTRTVFSLVAMLNFYFRFRLISHSNVCQKYYAVAFFFCTAIKTSHRPKF
jgi:hypothetical protein